MTRNLRIFAEIILVATVVGSSAVSAVAAPDNWEIVSGSTRESTTVLRDGLSNLAEVTFTVRNVGAGVGGGREFPVVLVYDHTSHLGWWMWWTEDPQKYAPTWTVARSINGRSLVGFCLEPGISLGVRASSVTANSVAEAQLLAARALSGLDDPLSDRHVPGQDRMDRSAQRKSDAESYLQLRIRSRMFDEIFFTAGSAVFDREVRLRGVTAKPYGWDVEIQGARVRVGRPQTQGPPQVAVLALSHDFRFIAPDYTVVDAPVSRTANLADGTTAEVLQFTAGSLAEPRHPRLNITMLRDPVSNGVWWHWWVPEPEPPSNGRTVAPRGEPRSRRLDTWMVARQSGLLVGFIHLPGLRLLARSSTQSAASAAEGITGILVELAKGIPLPVDAGGDVALIQVSDTMRNQFPSVPILDAGSIQRVIATKAGWEIELDSGSFWPSVSVSKEFEITDVKLLPPGKR